MNRWWQASISVALAFVYPLTAANALDARQIPKRAETRSFTAELTKVDPWCNHMPIYLPGERRQYLIATLALSNHTDQPPHLTITQAAISFDEQSQGQVVTGLSVQGENVRSEDESWGGPGGAPPLTACCQRSRLISPRHSL